MIQNSSLIGVVAVLKVEAVKIFGFMDIAIVA